MLPRYNGGKRVPPPIARMRADDLLAHCFPNAMACGETLPPGDIEVPMDHPIVRQTVEDCLHEAMDVDGFLDLLAKLEDGRIARVAVDLPEPSVFARGILAAQPYAFLDDAPLEERRTQAVRTRHALEPKCADDLGALDPDAVARVRAEAWPQPDSAEELHEALLWMGFLTDEEARAWPTWLGDLASARRVERRDGRWFATEAPKSGKEVLRGRLEALGPVAEDDPLIAEFAIEIRELESEGAVLRARFPRTVGVDAHASNRDASNGVEHAADTARAERARTSEGAYGWCVRRLLARIHRYTIDRLRQSIQPATAAEFMRFLAHWQHVVPGARLEGTMGVLAVIEQLAGFQAPARAWEKHILPARVAGYRAEWLEALLLSGAIAWGRLWGAGSVAPRNAPIAFFRREDIERWLALEPRADPSLMRSDAQVVHEILERRGPSFASDLSRDSRLLPSRLEAALGELVSHGLATCDSFSGLASLFPTRSKHRARANGRFRFSAVAPAGRWSSLRAIARATSADDRVPPSNLTNEMERFARAELAARTLLARTGVVFRSTVLREKIPVAWRDVLIALRRMEARGEIHGGRFVAGFHGEQYALPEAVKKLRALRNVAPEASAAAVFVDACDPLNFVGILTPDERVAANAKRPVPVTAA
jgi:ATP-dependent Lhr-like helicase